MTKTHRDGKMQQRRKKRPQRAIRPIEHVVLIVKENHCFDNYFGTFPGADGMVMPRSPNPPTQDPNHRHDACLVLSPYAKRGHISKVLHSHVSLLKFCETTFGLGPLNKRDAAAHDMSNCFDFQKPPTPPPAANPV